jgi:hypothetical protein
VRRPALLIALAFIVSDVHASAAPDEPPATPRPWIDLSGTAIVGFGLLRVVPSPGKTATFDVRYVEKSSDYGQGTGGYQLFVLPGDAYAKKTSAYADEFLAFTRSKPSQDSDVTLTASFQAASETTVLVAYGPWTAPDSGRPSGDRPVFRLDVTPHDGAFEWIESEMGELITNNWTNRPGVKRGGPFGKDDPQWVEVRPMILYDGRMAADAQFEELKSDGPLERIPAPASRDQEEARADGQAYLVRSDRRILLTHDLAEKFRRVPIRWR